MKKSSYKYNPRVHVIVKDLESPKSFIIKSYKGDDVLLECDIMLKLDDGNYDVFIETSYLVSVYSIIDPNSKLPVIIYDKDGNDISSSIVNELFNRCGIK